MESVDVRKDVNADRDAAYQMMNQGQSARESTQKDEKLQTVLSLAHARNDEEKKIVLTRRGAQTFFLLVHPTLACVLPRKNAKNIIQDVFPRNDAKNIIHLVHPKKKDAKNFIQDVHRKKDAVKIYHCVNPRKDAVKIYQHVYLRNDAKNITHHVHRKRKDANN